MAVELSPHFYSKKDPQSAMSRAILICHVCRRIIADSGVFRLPSRAGRRLLERDPGPLHHEA